MPGVCSECTPYVFIGGESIDSLYRETVLVEDQYSKYARDVLD